MLLQPGEPFDFDGRRLTYPRIRLVYWCGGNPFHHHQDLARLRRALATPDTIVVHDPFWTPMARHADIVLPATMTLERNDIGGSPNDPCLIAMRQAIEPYAEARSEYAIFTDLAEALGVEARFTEGRDEMAWLRHLYESWREKVVHRGGPALPGFDEFWAAGSLEVTDADADLVLLKAFRDDPEGARLGTPSGRIEIFSETIDRFGYKDCPGHPSWLEPTEWLGAPLAERYPLHLVANNPTTRLHSQLDVGAFSQASKVQGREPIRIHPADAAEPAGSGAATWCGSSTTRGSCLAGAVVTDAVRPRVVQLATGAWYDPLDPAIPTRCASTATRTCSRSTAAPRSSPRAAPASTPSSRSSGGRVPCHRSAPTTRRRRSDDPGCRSATRHHGGAPRAVYVGLRAARLPASLRREARDLLRHPDHLGRVGRIVRVGVLENAEEHHHHAGVRIGQHVLAAVPAVAQALPVGRRVVAVALPARAARRRARPAGSASSR